MSKRTYPLNDSGYVTTWLVSGRLDTPVDPATRTIIDQGKYEYHLKQTIHDDSLSEVPKNIELGAPGINDELPWYMYQSGPNSFIDLFKFYFVIYRCEFWAATSIVSPIDQKVDADIWNYPSYDAWLNGEHVSVCKECQYLPMRRNHVTLSLKKGENLFFLRVQNACARDTRNIVALSFPGNPDIRVAYPGKDNPELDAERDTLDWIHSIRWNGEQLVTDKSAPEGVVFTVNGTVNEGTAFTVEPNTTHLTLCAEICGISIERKVEISERIVPAKKLNWNSPDEAREAFIKSLTDRKVDATKSRNCQHFYTTYARLCKGYELDENDIEIIRACLEEVNIQKDCSDFRFGYVLASVKKGLFPDYLIEEVHEAALKYSYWLDEMAVGAMCYNSENHSLLFHSCQMLAGMMWPDEIFTASGRTGKEQYEIACQRIDKWLTNIENNGFAEFLSGGYTSITVAAMLTVVDFASDELSIRTSKLIDEIFYAIVHNSFDGVVYAPQGRIYRGVIMPWNEGTQSLLYYATGTASPSGIGAIGSFLAAFAGSKYRIPADIEEHLNIKGMFYGKAQGTRIQTYKGNSFMLTSLPLEIVNGECFGKFKPGSIGYQQHLSYATLGGACIVYPQHPGLTYDAVTIRPGYWFGNGYFPAQKQWDNVIGHVFPLDEEHPVKFTHLYFPTRCFDEWKQEGNWLFGRRGNGYIAVWCSSKLSLFDKDIVQGCDFRAENGAAGYLTVCGDSEIYSDYESFKNYAKDFAPEFNRTDFVLTTKKGHKIGGEFIGSNNP